MSTAWAALEAATTAEPPLADDIRSAIRHAKPYKELAELVRAAESFLRSLVATPAGALPGIHHTQHSSAQTPSTAGTASPVPIPMHHHEPDAEAFTKAERSENGEGDTLAGTAGEPHGQADGSQGQAEVLAAQQNGASEAAEATEPLDEQAQLLDQAPPSVASHDGSASCSAHDTALQAQDTVKPAQPELVSPRRGLLSPEAVASARAAALLALRMPAPSPETAGAASSAVPSQSEQISDTYQLPHAAAKAQASSQDDRALHDDPSVAEAETAESSGASDHQPDSARQDVGVEDALRDIAVQATGHTPAGELAFSVVGIQLHVTSSPIDA